VVGIVATLALARVLGSLLFEISPADPLAIVGTVLTWLAVASFIPAWRAATIDPLITMRAN
jgi:ABC-type lipoprotein release transport system permease subunit